MWSASFLPIQSMWALALLMELGPHKDRGKLWPGWELNSRPSGLITAAPPTETQGQTGAGRGNWRCQFHGNEYVQLSTRKGYVFVANVCRVALIVEQIQWRHLRVSFAHETNLVSRVFHVPTRREAREERAWFRLVTCLGDKFIFMVGVPIYQSIVAAAVCYLLNRLSGMGNYGKLSFDFAATICQIKYIAFNIWN